MEDAARSASGEPPADRRWAEHGGSLFGGIGSVCSAAVRLSNVDGGAVALLSATSSARELVYATDALAQQIDELQFVLGEGPCLDAYHSREQQLWPDMTVRAARERWPVFSSDVVSLQARAMFAYPVLTGETAVGVLELYRTAPGDLSEVEQQAGRACAAAIGSLLASEVEQMAELVDSPDSTVAESTVPEEYSRAVVYNAAGMVAVQLAVSAEEALHRLRAYSYADGRPIGDVATDIVQRRLSLRPQRDGGEGQG